VVNEFNDAEFSLLAHFDVNFFVSSRGTSKIMVQYVYRYSVICWLCLCMSHNRSHEKLILHLNTANMVNISCRLKHALEIDHFFVKFHLLGCATGNITSC
jgi:hypothetical protein